MTRRALLLTASGAFAAALAVTAATAGPAPFGIVTTVQLERGRKLESATLADVDGDARPDLVLATSRGGRRADRRVEVHLRRASGDAFVGAPDVTLDVPEDATAFAVGDVHEDAGSEIVLFTSSGAYAWRPKGPDDARFVRLAGGAFLWQLADPKELFVWDAGVRDVDGDGLADLVLPEPDGWRIAFQRRPKEAPANFAAVSAPRVPVSRGTDDGQPMGARKIDAKQRRNELRVSITVGGDAGANADLADVSESVPSPQFLDWDADGRADLLAQTSEDLCVWLQREDGFAETPDLRFELPVLADRERRLDVSYSALVADLDGDRRADSVLLAGDKRAADVRTQVLVFVQGRSGTPDPASPLFGADGVPTQLLRIGGFAGRPQIADVDGDGRPDLVVGAVRVDGSFDVAKAAGDGTLDAEVYVYRNRGASFSAAPDVRYAMSVKADGLRRTRSDVTANFVGDVTGDGVRDLLVRDAPDHLRLLMTRRVRDAFTVVETPLFETSVDEDAAVAAHPGTAGGPPELLVAEDAQVLHVRFR